MPQSKRKSKYCSEASRRSYTSKKRKHSTKMAIAARWQNKENKDLPQTPIIAGSRIMNMDELSKGIEELTSHSAKCGGTCSLQGETKHAGLAVVLAASCDKCQQQFRIRSSTQVSTADGSKKWSINLAAVMSQMATGGGKSRLDNVLTTMGVSGMPKRMFAATERFLGESMKQQLLQSMAEAGREEKEHAVAIGHFHQDVPYISVVVDGGWSKRTHKHSYNAKSGVAVIFGLHTKKLLFIGVRNKYCSVCAVAEHKEQTAPDHACYRNWNGSSCAMESDIVAEGFRLSETMHGIRYLKVVGDGDSSVMATIRQAISYGRFVEKIECANHAVKCYRSRLEALAKDHSQYRGKGGLTKRAIQRLTVGARIAIRMHSKDGNVQQLRHDLRNGPAHVFGDHSSCNPSFCTHRERQSDHPLLNDEAVNDTNEVEVDQSLSLADQIASIAATELVNEPTSEEEEAARTGHNAPLSSLPDGLFRKVLACGDRLVTLAPQVISNLTSNLAECYMAIRTNCDGGKQYNRIQSGSFEHRCYTAGLQVQHGPQWRVKFWEKTTGQPACPVRLHTHSQFTYTLF